MGKHAALHYFPRYLYNYIRSPHAANWLHSNWQLACDQYDCSCLLQLVQSKNICKTHLSLDYIYQPDNNAGGLHFRTLFSCSIDGAVLHLALL